MLNKDWQLQTINASYVIGMKSILIISTLMPIILMKRSNLVKSGSHIIRAALIVNGMETMTMW